MEEVKKEKELKKSKKKNKVASLLLALALILTCGVAGTIAQYQKSFGGTGTANVAKFDVSATNLNEKTSDTIDLFDSVYDTDGSGNLALETDAQNGIAPGTQGYFETVLTNNSDVNVEYELGITMAKSTGIYNESGSSLDNKFIPLQFAILESTTEPTTTAELDAAFNNGTAIDLSTKTPVASQETTLYSPSKSDLPMDTTSNKNVKKAYICWRWAYKDATSSDARNQLDTAIGEAIANKGSGTFTKPQVKVEVTFTQKN